MIQRVYKCSICLVTIARTEDATALNNFARHMDLMHDCSVDGEPLEKETQNS